MIKKLLIANRGEIACRIIRTARRMNIATVAVYADADAKALHVASADEAVHIGASAATESYLVIDKIIAAAKATGADAIHPGYGFLSENADLPEACAKAGIAFVGPSAAAMRALGGKAAAKEIAIKAGVPVVPGYQGPKQDAKALAVEAKKIGYPVMIKAVAGGGGRGMRLVEKEADLAELLDSAKREAQSAFGNPDVLIEKVVVAPRHIEVQVFGDRHGNAVHLFERDCTLQRRNQKVIEEAPAPGMSDALRQKMCDAAVKLAKSVGYEGAGTVEFLVEGGSLAADAPWYFIEMNTRLQVEHPVTEEITGLDLVEWQLRVASGEKLPLAQKDIKMSGHAIEVRLCAEDPAKGFMPSVGKITLFDASRLKPDTRLETGVRQGDSVSPYYDSMIAKVIEHAADRPSALRHLARELDTFPIAGVRTNTGFLVNLLRHEGVMAGRMDTGLIARDMDSISDQRISRATLEKAAARLVRHGSTMTSKSSTLPSDPWSTPDAFVLGESKPRSMRFDISGETKPVAVRWNAGTSDSDEPYYPDAAIGDLAIAADTLPGDRHAIELIDNGAVAVFERGRQVVISRPTYDASDIDDDNGHGGNVRAPINGRVAKVFVAAGDTVEKGDRIAVVEAMKMEHVLHAGISGKIEKVSSAEGAQVTQGTVLVTIA